MTAGEVVAVGSGSWKDGMLQHLAVTNQIEDARSARHQVDERRLSVIRWAVRTEANRVAAAVAALRNRALPSGPQPAARSREQLVIESSPLLRGEREEISLLRRVPKRRRDVLDGAAAGDIGRSN